MPEQKAFNFVERLDASHRGAGNLKINDRAKGTPGVPLETHYGRSAGEILPVDGSYQPEPGWRYQFTVGKETETRTTTTYVKATFWGSDNLAKDPANIVSQSTVNLTEPKLIPAGSYFVFTPSNVSPYTYTTQETTNNASSYISAQWTYQKNVFTTKYYYTTYVDTRSSGTVSTHSFRADKPIAIDFIGQSEGSISVDTSTTLYVSGSIINPTGRITLKGKSVNQTGEDATLSGRQIDINATTGSINGIRTNLTDVSTAWLKASAVNDISIHEVAGVLPVYDVISTGSKSVSLTSQNGIIGASGFESSHKIQGGSISLDAGSGGIGSTTTSLRLNTGADKSHVLTALAKGDIFLAEINGDLRVKEILSSSGDVRIGLVNGSLVDGNTSEIADTRTADELRNGLWANLQLTEGTGSSSKIDETIAGYASSKNQEYRTYWQWRNQQDDPTEHDFSYHVEILGAERAAYDSLYRTEGERQGLSGQPPMIAVITTLVT